MYTTLDFFKTVLGLSEPEIAVFNALIAYQMPQRATTIAHRALVSAKMTGRILHSFEKRRIVLRHLAADRHDRWRYNKKLNYFFRASGRTIDGKVLRVPPRIDLFKFPSHDSQPAPSKATIPIVRE